AAARVPADVPPAASPDRVLTPGLSTDPDSPVRTRCDRCIFLVTNGVSQQARRRRFQEAAMSRSSLRSRAVPSARRIVTGSAVVLAALALSTTAPASATGFAPSSTHSATHPSTEQRAGTLDGFVIENLPDGLGMPSDFEYEWEDVSFHSRVWETGPDPEGAFKVDLTVKTLRGEKLTDLEALKT